MEESSSARKTNAEGKRRKRFGVRQLTAAFFGRAYSPWVPGPILRCSPAVINTRAPLTTNSQYGNLFLCACSAGKQSGNSRGLTLKQLNLLRIGMLSLTELHGHLLRRYAATSGTPISSESTQSSTSVGISSG